MTEYQFLDSIKTLKPLVIHVDEEMERGVSRIGQGVAADAELEQVRWVP